MKRLEKQLGLVNQMKDKGVSAKQKQTLFHWQVTINGPVDSPFENGKFILLIDFPETFPFSFPHFKFRTPIYHPNIRDGEICKEMLGQNEWMPNKKVVDVLQIILSMLISPDIGSAINLEAAQDYKQGKYEQKVREMVAKQKEQN